MLSGITPLKKKKKKKTKPIKIQKFLHMPEFSSFTDSLDCKGEKILTLTSLGKTRVGGRYRADLETEVH